MTGDRRKSKPASTSLRLGLGLVAVALASSRSPAQPSPGQLVVPAEFAYVDAPGLAFWVLSPFRARRQLLVGNQHLIGARMRSLLGLSVRRNTGADLALDGGRVVVALALSHSPALPDAPSNRFASNRGADPRVVFAGPVDLPSTPPSPTVPAPWATPFAIELPFDIPFVYRGGTLCIEAVTEPYRDPTTGVESSPWWTIDAVVERNGGASAAFGVSCVPGMPGAPSGADARSFVPGSDGVFFLRGMRPFGWALSVLSLSASSLADGTPLPLDLSEFRAPGCWLYVDPQTAIPTPVTRLPRAGTGYAQISVPIPFDPDLVGAQVFHQWFMQDVNVNPIHTTFSNGVRATIGSRGSTLGLGWIESSDPMSAVGRVLAGRAPVIRLELQ